MTSTTVKLSATMERALRYWADIDAAPCYRGGNASTRAALVTRGLLTPERGTSSHGITAAGREWIAAADATLAAAPQAAPERCRSEGDGLSIRTSLRTVHAPVCTCTSEEPTPASKPDPEKLIAAAARMADRMCATLHRAGLAVGRGDGWEKLHARGARQGRVMHRLLDAAQRAHGARPTGWHLDYTLMTIADHRRTYAREQLAAATKGA